MTKKPSEPEDEYFARVDAEKKRQMAVEKQRTMAKEEQEALKKLHFMHCPKCGQDLHHVTFRGQELDRCFNCNGTWLDAGELEALVGREPGFLASVVGLFK
jgi:hypothetical protein